MRISLTASLLTALSIAPAVALDVGVGASVGGIGVGASIGIDKSGASVGAGANVGNLGGAKADTSISPSKGSIDTSVGLGASVGGQTDAQAETSISSSKDATTKDVGVDATSGSKGVTGPAAQSSVNGKGTSRSAARGGIAKNMDASALPRTLKPSQNLLPHTPRRPDASRWGYPSGFMSRVLGKLGTPRSVAQLCRRAIISVATPIGATRVSTTSAGSARRLSGGGLAAPINVRIDYRTRQGVEVRQAKTTCRLDAAGRVVALK